MTAGVLAIWNDRAPEYAAEYERWYVAQHLPERVGVPGFRFGRRYEAATGTPRFFTWYETESPEVLGSEAYRGRLDDPTPETRQAMASFRNMIRTECRRAAALGVMLGAWAAVARLGAGPEDVSRGETAWLTRSLGELVKLPGVVAAQLWMAEPAPPPAATEEAALRGAPDGRIGAVLLVETQREEEARAASDALAEWLGARGAGAAPALGVYRLLCELRADGIGPARAK